MIGIRVIHLLLYSINNRATIYKSNIKRLVE